MHADALVGRLPERDGARAQLRVEPAPRLVLSFGDEVRRPEGVEFCGPSRVPERCPRGYRRVEPDIEDVLDPLHGAAAVARDRDLVHIRAVGVGERFSAPVLEFLDGTDDAVFVALFADPDRDRDAPVALARDAPVAGFLDPVIEPGAAGPLGVPRHLLHFREHQVPHLRGFQEPLGGCPEDDRGLAAPAVAVAVGDLLLCEQVGAERHEDILVCVPHVLAGKLPGLVPEPPGAVHRADNSEAFFCPEHVVVPAVAGRDMDHAGIFKGDEVRNKDLVVDVPLERHLCKERGIVRPPREVSTFLRFDDGEVLVPGFLEHGFHERFGNPEEFLVPVLLCAHLCVLEVL